MIERRSLIAAFAASALVFLAQAPHAAAADLEDGAGDFIRSLAETAVESLTDPDTPRALRVERFRRMFNESFAVRPIGKFVLGRYWRRADVAEKAEYLTLFEDLMVASYVDRFANYSGKPLNVLRARTENPRVATVFSEIERSGGGRPIRVEWRVGFKDDMFKILDVVVEGTSMSNTLRSEFASIIRRNGGQVEGLLKELRIKTADLEQQATN